MTIRFDGQVAIVTGSGRGLGRAYATLLAARGASVVVHNAGWITFTPLEEMTPELLEGVLNIQVKAPFWLSQAAFPTMQHQRYGRIIFTTSGRGMFLEDALPELSGYAIGKMAQLGLMNALAAAGAAYGIRVNAISPVAATRMFFSPVASGELRPEQVAPEIGRAHV